MFPLDISIVLVAMWLLIMILVVAVRLLLCFDS